MEPEGSLPCSQKPATGPYAEPDESIFRTRFFKIQFNILLPSLPSSSKWYLPTSLSD
jgi:hypothetical protein